MNKIRPIKISKNEINNEFGFSRMDLKIKGDDINHVIVNSIKRVIQTDIPVFAFNTFDITTNTSVFNNNYIKSHIRNIPVWGIENNLDEYIKKEKKDDEEFSESMGLINDDIDLNVDKDIDMSSLTKLTMYLDFKNTESNIKTVTTDNAKFYYKEGMIKSPYKNPIQLVKLQPNQEIKLSAQAELGNEEISGIFSAVSACYFKEISDTEYDFILESRGQHTEKRILEIALKSLNKILQKFNEKLPKNKGMEGKIVVDNEDHTLGNIISYGMQNHPSVKFCGYNTPHPLKKQIEIHYKLENGNLNSIIKDVIVYYENIFDNIRETINKTV